MLIDTHCHIHDSDYAISADDVLAHAKACGVQKMITIGTTPANSQEAREFAIDASDSKSKHAWFGKYKGRINNWLTARGYDLKSERDGWNQRIEAAKKQK